MALETGQATRELAAALRDAGDPTRAVQEKRYLKSELEHFGASVPAIRRVAVGFVDAHPGITGPELIELVRAMWEEPVHELRMAVVELLDRRGALLGPEDMALLERLIRQSRTWALVDGLAVTVVGRLVQRFPACPAAAAAAGGVRFRPLLPLRRADARGARVLHPQGDRMGAARDGQGAPRPRLRLARAASAQRLGRHRARGRQVPAGEPARGRPPRLSRRRAWGISKFQPAGDRLAVTHGHREAA